MSFLTEASKNIINLPRFAKRIITIIIDLGLCISCTWLAFYLRLEQFIKINDITILAVLISTIIAIPIFWLHGLYRTILRFGGTSIIFTVSVAVLVYGIIYFSIISIFGIQGIPRSIGIIQPLLLFLGITSSRIAIKFLFPINTSIKNIENKKKLLIYGAGNAGRQLLLSLENNPEMKAVGFLDDNKQFHNQTVLGQTVFDPINISKLINSKNIDLVLLALPSISRKKRNEIINDLNKHKISVKTLPSIQDIVDGKISVSDIKDLIIEDLLNREQVKPDIELLSKNVSSKVVVVTGAGGSIGSELCRQITRLKPKKLLLIELNEFALYNIYEELKNLNQNLNYVPLLLNVQSISRLNEVFRTFKVDTVYHAAAYKHVPLVEENICESIKNNVFGTFSIAQTAIQNNVSNFVLISSDKAVRSTNVMGASKRLAEICIQALYNKENKNTKFAIVRFGNVLQSSGSVIPKFKKQIRQGGPVTLTHPEVTRYFMTIIEASQLVIQAGAMSEACEVFVLDMGKSVKIRDLINKMIKLSGLSVKDNNNLGGDIEVKIIGLRPGEKLYEELLLGDNPQKTYHDKIQKAQDPFIPFDQLKIELDNLSVLVEDNRASEIKDMLHRLVPSYKSNSKIVDLYYEESLKNKNDLKKSTKVKDQENKVVRIKT
ncbi:polysaccharide biosynthesis protein CapD [Candidatus Pelagibacter sp. HTCC7211]|uniref:polysaccharide biosynthesis protein n=2 Tax=Pseudomonadota TaxID=1224 RepID=UPI000183A1D6|nr:nucleoside-diphosphate sugar epimerase/dehydratase [Candidatus Pelagibacter sp. HTCC7211]EDZ61069.1 polysaccharide biosynthesis protein CapD [Candidatus Pelagibacter sp. HTCC7211]MBD1151459.1 polysaccharide biosynthesis protein [Pelagibacterales bacterium SAG-MED25]